MNQSFSQNTEFEARGTMPVKENPVTNRRGGVVTGVRSALKVVAHQSAGVLSNALTKKLTDWLRQPPTIAAYLIILLLVITTCYLGYTTHQSAQQTRRSDGEQNVRLTQLEERISQTNKQIATLSQSNRGILSRLSMPARLWEDYRGGVCLIYGSYIFIDNDTDLPVVGTTDSSALVGQTQTVKEAAGEPAEVRFEATGFHAGDGYILTNRHTVEPWKYNFLPAYFSILRNARPRLTKLLAFFPDRSQPYALEVKLISSHDDIAICKLGAAVDPKEIPALPLDSGHQGDEIGDEVTMLSYPNGTDRLLAVTQVAERQRLLKRFGESSPSPFYRTKNDAELW